MRREIIRTKNFARDAADLIVERARGAFARRDNFRIALSGGNTPRPVYRELASRSVPWQDLIITFSDERCVPPDNEQSNFRMAKETLLEPARIPDSSVLRMRGELVPAEAADQYDEQLDALARKRGEGVYQHDLILLGIGDDGHTASLFPGTAALSEMSRSVVANYIEKLDSWRLTFTLPLIFAARVVCFLVGAKKDSKLIDRVLSGDRSLPATLVDEGARHVIWVIAEAA